MNQRLAVVERQNKQLRHELRATGNSLGDSTAMLSMVQKSLNRFDDDSEKEVRLGGFAL